MATANLNLFSSRCVVTQGPSLMSTRMGMRMTFQKSDRRRVEKVSCVRNTDRSLGIAKGEGEGVFDGVERKYSSASKAEEEVDVGPRECLAVAEATVVLGKEEEAEGIEWKWPPWDTRLPQRYRIIGATSLAFVICNMDKVNLSIAIIPMSHQFGWNSSTAGLVQSSFFWGYALSQLPGGWLSKIFGGSKVLEVGVLTWSLATALVPSVAGFMPGLILSRILVGIGEGVSPSAATDLIARSIPLAERSRAVAVVFGGLSVGSVLGLILAPSIIQSFGWETVFYIFGVLGVIWCLGFDLVKEGRSLIDSVDILGLRNGSPRSIVTPSAIYRKESEVTSLSQLDCTVEGVLQKSCSLGDDICSFLWKLGTLHLFILAPYFFQVSVLPSLGAILVTSITAPFADSLISRGFETTKVRKICQTIAFLSPAVCMTLSSLDLGLPPWEIVFFLTSGLALSNFALSGLYCTHQDISPEYAGILLGITNTIGALPGIVGVTLTGYLLDSTHSWSMSLFFPSIFFYLTGTVVWLTFASSEPQNFSKMD